jgi:murein L,D-transpeptidase YcbB/YkuD
MLRVLLVALFSTMLCLNVNADDDDVKQALRARIEQMRDSGAQSLMVSPFTVSEAVAQLYERRNFALVWRDEKRVERLFTELAKLDVDGLDPQDYQLDELRKRYAARKADTIPQRVDFELLMSNAYLRALMHLFGGKIDQATLQPRMGFALNDITGPDSFAVVNDALDNYTIAGVFELARPQHPLYERTQSALRILRDIAAKGGWPTIEGDIALKPGMQDAQMPALRKRLQLAGYLDAAAANNPSDVYDDVLVAAVKKFQREQYLDSDGAIGPSTRKALNIPVQARIDQVRVNLERGRWLLRDVPRDFVLVDVAGYKASYFKNGRAIWNANVQVGRPYRSTPSFKSKITYITLNPTWTVPPTILTKDVLPQVRRDIGYLAKNNIRVLDNRGRELDPNTINWQRPGNILLRQDAGPRNSLGRVVIRFPNDHAIYMHDTPHTELFDDDQRAFSSGCIRVERPRELVELLMNDSNKWNRAAIDAMIAKGETRNVDLAKPVPIVITYWTIDTFNGEHVAFKPDIYQRDPEILAALNKKL